MLVRDSTDGAIILVEIKIRNKKASKCTLKKLIWGTIISRPQQKYLLDRSSFFWWRNRSY